MDEEVVLLLESPDHQAPGAGRDVPVHRAEIVAGGVGSVIREFQARPEDAAAALRVEEPGEAALREQGEPLEEGGEAVVEERPLLGGVERFAGRGAAPQPTHGQATSRSSRTERATASRTSSGVTPSDSPSKLRRIR